MIIHDQFSPAHFQPNPAIMASVSEHRQVMGEVPIERLLKQVKKCSVKTTYPPNWRTK